MSIIDTDICRITIHRKLIVAPFRGNTFNISLLLTVTHVARQYTKYALLRFHDNNGYAKAPHIMLHVHFLIYQADEMVQYN